MVKVGSGTKGGWGNSSQQYKGYNSKFSEEPVIKNLGRNYFKANPQYKALHWWASLQLYDKLFIELRLELTKDVVLLGPTSVGKSSIMASLTLLLPKITSEGPTTIYPLIGSLNFIDRIQIKIMEMPGMVFAPDLQGAHKIQYLHQMNNAKLILIVLDLGDNQLFKYIQFYVSKKKEICGDTRVIFLLNKMDLVDQEEQEKFVKFLQSIHQEVICISVKKKKGLSHLVKTLREICIH